MLRVLDDVVDDAQKLKNLFCNGRHFSVPMMFTSTSQKPKIPTLEIWELSTKDQKESMNSSYVAAYDRYVKARRLSFQFMDPHIPSDLFQHFALEIIDDTKR